MKSRTRCRQGEGERHVLVRRLGPEARQAAGDLAKSIATWCADMGLTQQDVGASLGAALGGGYVNYFSIAGRSYKVIPQVLQKYRLNPDQVLDYYVRAGDGSLIAARTIAHIKTSTVPEAINHFQQLNSATIAGAPGVSQADALGFLRAALQEVAPAGYNVDYSGQSRQYVRGSSGFVVTMLFALVIVYLALAAQFESFRDPAVILVSVPMALFGALLFINFGARHTQYLHAGGAGHAARSHQQARHSDRAVRQ